MKTVAVDFDGVLHAYRKGWHDGTIYDDIVQGSVEAIKRLQVNHAVYVLTSRTDVLMVSEYLRRHGIPAIADIDNNTPFWDRQDVVLVTNRKLPAIAYIDDRAVRFVSWDQALDDMCA